MVYISIIASYQQYQEIMYTKASQSNYQQEAKPTSFRAARQSMAYPSSTQYYGTIDDQPRLPSLQSMPCQPVFCNLKRKEMKYRISATMASSIVPRPSPSMLLNRPQIQMPASFRLFSMPFLRVRSVTSALSVFKTSSRVSTTLRKLLAAPLS
jgi:hypothetical protein